MRWSHLPRRAIFHFARDSGDPHWRGTRNRPHAREECQVRNAAPSVALPGHGQGLRKTRVEARACLPQYSTGSGTDSPPPPGDEIGQMSFLPPIAYTWRRPICRILATFPLEKVCFGASPVGGKKKENWAHGPRCPVRDPRRSMWREWGVCPAFDTFPRRPQTRAARPSSTLAARQGPVSYFSTSKPIRGKSPGRWSHTV